MTTITAKMIEDSVSEAGIRLTTMQLRYPRWIHAEGRTHRQLALEEELEYGVTYGTGVVTTPSLMHDPNLSRNASSSRAIPVERLVKDVLDDPAIPVYWGANQRGMQAGAECNEPILTPHGYRVTREEAWLEARDRAVEVALSFDRAGYHKQIVNRLLEPFSHINVVVTATEWTNFFALRIHKDAEPHINLLATLMRDAMDASTPRTLRYGQWHLPYVLPVEIDAMGGREDPTGDLRLISVARNARLSYLTHDGKPPAVMQDLDLARRLIGSVPLHASPAEHQARPDRQVVLPGYHGWENAELHGNFRGWVQHRKILPGECQ